MKNNRTIKRVLIAVVIFMVLAIIFGLIAFPYLLLQVRKGHKDVTEESRDAFDVEIKENFIKTSDDLDLVTWQIDAKKPKAMIIFLSGIENPSVTSFFGHGEALEREGYSSFFTEMRGHGRSEGDGVELGYKEVLDVKASIDFIKEQKAYEDIPIVVYGTSMGGVTAINAGGIYEDIDGVISLSAYSSWSENFSDIAQSQSMPKYLAKLEEKLTDFFLKRIYTKEELKNEPRLRIKEIKDKPILLVHSNKDTQVSYENFKRLVAKNEMAETYVREGNHHMIIKADDFNKPETDQEYWEVLMTFLNKHYT